MTIQFDLPSELERELREDHSDLAADAKEVYLIWLYRHDKLTKAQVGDALGLTRLEMDGVLNKHSVTEDLLTIEEYDQSLQQFHEITKQ